VDTLEGVSKFIESLEKKTEPKEQVLPKRELVFDKDFNFSSWPEREENLRMDMLGYIEEFFYEHQRLPVRADFEIRFSKSQLPHSFNGWKDLLLSLQDQLDARGLPTFSISEGYMEPEFIAAVGLILDYHDKRTTQAKLKQAGVTTKKFSAWMRIDKYREYYENRLNDIVDDDLINSAKLGLTRLVTSDDLQAIKFAFEVKNLYNPHQNTNQNIMLIMQVIMEILAKHVDKTILNSVANELSATVIGELSA